MAWTAKQKKVAVMACRSAGITEEQRVDMILRHFANARQGGRITSTAKALTNADYAAFMAIVERASGGKVLHFTQGYWQKQAADELAPMRRRAYALAAALESAGKLAANGVGLSGWIASRIRQAVTDKVEELDYHGLLALTVGLKMYARQEGVTVA